ncbi:MAG: HEAT repeat domain-containing protein [Planctomycetales bacterium]|nr:HEAT repeat domain-containing protein [Planctomycetales bacterium]
MVALLGSRKPAVRLRGIESTRYRNELEPAVLKALARLLIDPNPEIREDAAKALGAARRLGKLLDVVDELAAALNDPNEPVAYWVALAIGHQGAKASSAVEALAQTVSREDSNDWAKVTGRQMLGLPRSASAAAAEALGLIGDAAKPHAGVLRNALGRPDSGPHAGQALARLGEASWLLDQLKARPDEVVRNSLIQGLAIVEPTTEEIVDTIIAETKNRGAKFRSQAIEALGKLRPANETQVAALGALLRDNAVERGARVKIAEALGAIEPKLPSAVPHLQFAAQLLGQEEQIATAAIASLGQYDSGGEQQLLIALGSTSRAGILSFDAMRTIQHDAETHATLAKIAQTAEHPRAVRLNALYVLREHGRLIRNAPELDSALAALLAAKDDPVVTGYAAALEIEGRKDTYSKAGPGKYPELSSALSGGLDAEPFDVKLLVIEGLGVLRVSAGAERLLQILEHDEQPALRGAAANALAAIGPVNADIVPSMLRVVRTSFPDDQYHRAMAVEQMLVALGKLGAREDVDPAPIAKLLTELVGTKQGAEFNRRAALASLGDLPPAVISNTLPVVESSLAAPSFRVRQGAGAALAKWGSAAKTAHGAVLRSLASPPEGDEQELQELRAQLIAALVAVTTDDTKQDSLRLLQAELSEDARFAAAAKAITSLGGGANEVPGLVRGLESNDFAVRLAATNALQAIGADAEAATPQLRAALDDPDRRVQVAAKRALLAIGVNDPELQLQLARLLFLNQNDTTVSVDEMAKSCAAIAAAALQCDDEELRAAVLPKLARVRGAAKQAYSDVYLAALDVGEPASRVQAALELRRMGKADERISAALLAGLGAEDQALRQQCRYALAEMGRGVRPALLAALGADDTTAEVKIGICRLCGERPVAVYREPLAALANAESGSPELTGWATVALAAIDRSAVDTQRLIKNLVSEDGELVAATMQLLPQDGRLDELSLNASLELLGSGKPTADEAAAALARSELSDEQLALFIAALENEQALAAAARKLGQRPTLEAAFAAPLARALRLGDDRVVAPAANALARIGSPALPMLLEVAVDTDVNDKTRARAITAIAQLREIPKQHMRDLAGIVTSDDPKLSALAAAAMGRLGLAHPKVFESLEAALESQDYEVQRQALAAYGRLGPAAAPATEGLIKLLGSQQAANRAAEALLQIAPESPGVLRAVIDAGLQSEAGDALYAMVGNEAAQAALVERLAQETEPRKVSLLARTIVESSSAPLEVDQSRRQQLVVALRKLLDDPDAQVWVNAARLTAKLAPDSPELLQAVRAWLSNENTARHALTVAKEMGPAAAPLLDDLKPLMHSERYAFQAINVIGGLGDAATSLAPDLAALLDDPRQAELIVHTLGQLGPAAAAAAPQLTMMLKDPGRTASAALALSQMGDAGMSSVGALRSLLADPGLQVDALQGLRSFEERAATALEQIIPLLDDSDPEVRAAAAGTIGAMKQAGRSAVGKLIELMKSDARVASAAARALGQLGGDEAKAALLNTASDSATATAIAAVQALGNWREEADVATALTAALRRPELKVVAARALGEQGQHAANAVPAIAALLTSPHDYERFTAIDSLAKIGAAARDAATALEQALGRAESYDERRRLGEALAKVRAEP